ncbi:mitochondrial ribonuclease P catalytic subunit [Heteronotia binoei]|uniref:mitochondrial ribonuclease P catalytic subunit n=1 Tax=Heteronotia binoei TaxID=13085 RepID=UPI00292E83A5|nr:mitochondrial ribonuclease P catalytic subunit [Heteronotia binoei]XP_060117292.1 mitochondrial ribonuclease P catalytic subunit [Heteronotia binoei]
MALFCQTTNWVLPTSLKTYQMFYPILNPCQLPAVLGCLICTTSSWSAKPIDPKAICKGTTKLKSTEKEDDIRQGRAGRYNFSPRPFNLFAAGASKMRSNQESLTDIKKPTSSKKFILCPPEKPLSVEEWGKMIAEFETIRKFEEVMFDQMIAHNSPIDVAKSLLVAVADRQGDIAYSLLVKYLTLCVSQKEVEEIYDIHDIMKTRYKVLETAAYSLLIRGLSGSQRWKEALSLLEEIKKVMTPSKGNYGDCIKGALINQDINLACELFYEMVVKDLMPNLDTIQAFFDIGKSVRDDQWKTKLIHILSYLRDNQVYPGEALMQSINQWFESLPGENWKGNLTTLKNSGQCPSCDQYLEKINLSPEEYDFLKQKIIKDVIQGTDTFRKTNPEELQEFQTFVNKRPPFDIVIDGLNVAKISPRYNPSQTLLDVVLHLANHNLRLLVLGRKHMLQGSRLWDQKKMAVMQKKADFFFTENVSEDDPFLLYATLHSGSHCRFVTRDLLRDHKACLPDSLTRRLFFKWQRGHQMVLSNYVPGKKMKFEPVLNYDTIVQTTGSTWHIPYDDSLLKRSSYEVPTTWLCLQQK